MLSRAVLRKMMRTRIAGFASEAKESSSLPQRMQMQDIQKNDSPIEKVSLSRGLAMNKFEKDFFIYPEYSDTDDVRNIEGFTEALRDSLELVVDSAALEREGSLPDGVRMALEKNGITSTFIPESFGGLGLCHKDMSRIYEELSVDWNVFGSVNVIQSASQLLILYGSEEQKSKYLPLIANGKCRPAVSLISNDEGRTMMGEAVGTSVSSSVLNLSCVPIVGSHNPNLVIVFAMSTHHASKERQMSCYIVDCTAMGEGETWKITRDDTVGLKALEVGKLNLVATVQPESILGEPGQGREIMGELACSSRLPIAAATIGHAKRLLGQLAAVCNRTQNTSDDNTMMSSDAGSQRATTSLALRLYSLESALYYLAGLLDEGMPIVADVENALIHRLSREVLRACVTATIELAGVRSADKSDLFEKNIRDVSTVMALYGEGNSVEQIAMATLSSWSSTNQKRITSTLRRLLSNDKTNADMKNPKLQHYIAEHAHPSLQLACQELEFSMSRVNTVISKMVAEQGKNVDQDYGSLENLVSVMQNQMAMVAVIARASRSYSVGLRNADIELAWATAIATRLSRANWFELEAMSDYFGLVRFNPSLLNAGRAVFDLGGYAIESPIQRNW